MRCAPWLGSSVTTASLLQSGSSSWDAAPPRSPQLDPSTLMSIDMERFRHPRTKPANPAAADQEPRLAAGMFGKPKLLFFQLRYSSRLPPFLLIHKREHVACLSHFFDVTVIDQDCDFQQVCDQHQPDLALFERGVP